MSIYCIGASKFGNYSLGLNAVLKVTAATAGLKSNTRFISTPILNKLSDQQQQQHRHHVQTRQFHHTRCNLRMCLPYNCVLVPTRSRWYTNALKGPKQPPTKHLDFDWSGDKQVGHPETDMTQPRVEYKYCSNLLDAPESVKKILSLGFGRSMDMQRHHIDDMLQKIGRHEGDIKSPEAKITMMTVKIRALIPYCLQYRKDKWKKKLLVEMIAKRRKYLKKMKQNDLAKFNWLCKELDIEYIPVPPPEVNFRKTIRMKRRLAVEEECHALVEAKRIAYRMEIEKQRTEFLAEKESIMAKINTELKELDLDGPALLQEVEDKAKKQEEEAEFRKKVLPRANNRYITVRIKES
ncbi:small ribosomal subunit protein uS15m-like [Tubulanus polymorphus]|uniref:small ribosomal subunit protein uS15m-like n=1 Tax=Tubulanus polymorphus TaxID=672921 RepID=UPI003DA20B2F